MLARPRAAPLSIQENSPWEFFDANGVCDGIYPRKLRF
jgi:hypothetical protein